MFENRTLKGGGIMYGKHLKKFRKSVGMTQQDIADELHLSRTAISKIENGTQEATINQFVRWAQVTNCDVQAALILFGTDIFANLSTVLPLIPAYIHTYTAVSQLFN